MKRIAVAVAAMMMLAGCGADWFPSPPKPVIPPRVVANSLKVFVNASTATEYMLDVWVNAINMEPEDKAVTVTVNGSSGGTVAVTSSASGTVPAGDWETLEGYVFMEKEAFRSVTDWTIGNVTAAAP